MTPRAALSTSDRGSPALGEATDAPFARLSIVLPAYNEEARLDPALAELFDFLSGPPPSPAVGPDRLPPEVEVLVVDDGSTDGTAAVLERWRARMGTGMGDSRAVTMTVVAVPHGGKGAAVRAGMLAATGDVRVFADADMATAPDQLTNLVAALGRFDVALGTRIQRDGSDMRASQPPARRILGRLFHGLAGLWIPGLTGDTQCGFKGFRAAAARDLFGRQRIVSIVFDVELIHLARIRGWTVTEVPIAWQDRRGSRMRPGIALALRVGWDLLRIRLVHGRDGSETR